MPRGPKKQHDYDAEIAEINAKIERKLDEVQELKAKKAELEKAQEQEAFQKLYNAVRSSGKSVDDVIAMLSK